MALALCAGALAPLQGTNAELSSIGSSIYRPRPGSTPVVCSGSCSLGFRPRINFPRTGDCGRSMVGLRWRHRADCNDAHCTIFLRRISIRDVDWAEPDGVSLLSLLLDHMGWLTFTQHTASPCEFGRGSSDHWGLAGIKVVGRYDPHYPGSALNAFDLPGPNVFLQLLVRRLYYYFLLHSLDSARYNLAPVRIL